MKNVLTTPVVQGITRREGLLSLLGSALALAGCGGGGGGGVASISSGGTGSLSDGGGAAISSGATGSFSVGPISGFGSIIVGAIRFDDSTASSILDDDGNTLLSNQLKLGMMVRVKGGKQKADSSANADSIEVRSELLGPIDSISGQTLVVLGQAVQVTVTTIFEEGLTGLSALAVGEIVEAHGFVNPGSNGLTATRIERKNLANVKAFKLQGSISALDSTSKTLRIGTLVISFAAPVDIPASLTLAIGKLVRVRLATTPAAGTRTALKIRAVEVEVADRDEAEVEGTITDFASGISFKVNGLPVTANGITVPAGLKLGDRVKVEGSLVNGVLVAKSVKLDDENDSLKFELHGKVDSLSTTAKTFVLRGVTVDYNGSPAFVKGTAANLINGVSVEVKGVTSAGGTKVKATRITFEKID